MADDGEWRVTATLRSTDDASRLLSRLNDAGENDGASISLVGLKLYGYGRSQQSVEAITARIRMALRHLSIDPAGIKVDKWLPDQDEWGDPTHKPQPEEDSGDRDDDPPQKKQGWISTIIDGLTGGTPG